MKKIHKTTFANGEMCKYKSMTFQKFKKMYGSTYFAKSIEDVYIELGGARVDTEPEPIPKKKKDESSD